MTTPSQLLENTVVSGAYRIIRPLSHGGMGAVYVVEQLATKKERALKVMRPELIESARLRERFIQEAQIGSKIESEHVVEVIDAGIDKDSGIPWLSMELLRGRTLGQRVRSGGPLSHGEAKQVFAELCHAVGAAHDVGIVHRDLKPDNVFLADTRREGGAFTVKVLDFGIAKLGREAGTHATGAIGTPLFMPPEQMVPGGTVTPAADVWALGLIAFYVLTGKSYWLSGNVESSSAMMVLNEVQNLPIVRPSERVKELKLDVTLPRGFDEWFLRAVHRVVDYRFSDARELRAALEPVLDGTYDPNAVTTFGSFVERKFVEGKPAHHLASDPGTTARSASNSSEPATVAAEPLGDVVDRAPARRSAPEASLDPMTDAGRASPTKPSAGSGGKPASSADIAHDDTVFGAGRTAPSQPKRARPMTPFIAGGAILALAVGLFWTRERPTPRPPESPAAPTLADSGAMQASSSATATSSALALPSALPSPADDPLESIVRLADLDLQSAHDKLVSLGPGAPALSDSRAAAVVDRWVEWIFTRSAADGPVGPRRALLTKVVNDALTSEKQRGQAFDRLLALEPRQPSAATRHLIIVETGKGGASELGPYARVAVVTELSRRHDVVIASPAATAYEIDRMIEEQKLRAVILRLDLSPLYEPSLSVKVDASYLAYGSRGLLATFTAQVGMPTITKKDPSAERDLALLAAQRIAGQLAKAQNSTKREPMTPTMPSGPDVVQSEDIPPETPTRAPTKACHCPPGDPLCECM
ncbi:MAG: protein kinase [Polyangiaceae bacterium]